MARPIKNGFDYFPFDVGFFRDAKIRITLMYFGTDGVLLYLYLLTVIYNQGYYVVFDEDLVCLASNDLQLSPEKIGQIINFFCKRSLFDNKLFTTDKVLSSTGIQNRYQQMIKARALKNPVTVNERFWLLKKEETETFVQVHPENNYSENNPSFSENNYTKQSKVNKSKVKQSKAKQSADDAANAAEKIDVCYFSVTGRHLHENELQTIDNLLSSGYSANELTDVISRVGTRAHCKPINSLNYFLPAIYEAHSNNTERYAPTFDSNDIEAILDAEWMSMPVGDDSEYNYDD